MRQLPQTLTVKCGPRLIAETSLPLPQFLARTGWSKQEVIENKISFWFGDVPASEGVDPVVAKPLTPEEMCRQFTEDDGSVWGVRFFNVQPPGVLISPSSAFVWLKPRMTARGFRASSQCRGTAGFHAAWPASLEAWQLSSIDHHTCDVKALVRGYPDIVLCEAGWRSQHCEIVQCYITQAVAATELEGLRETYPTLSWCVTKEHVGGSESAPLRPAIEWHVRTRDPSLIRAECIASVKRERKHAMLSEYA